ncbi:response regulator transcription factor [Arhodomonas aquaeolei]|uniref:response regulator n=1 Tax=Arhodomonas aquaeolei TaxID=2369 RepID=UPI001B7F7B2D|nr:response regulator transcription factor [Arhodomonas aquaeolei]MCS4503685.1 response regulator transcription factor [Arhodomonas aquaeolei]
MNARSQPPTAVPGLPADMHRVHVVLADDHALVRAGLRRLLELIDGVSVMGEVGDGRTLLRLLDDVPADVVLLDVEMPGMNGLEVLRRLRRAYPAVPVLMVSMHEEVATVARALRIGARGFLLKTARPEELERAVRAVHRGQRYLSESLSAAEVQAELDRIEAEEGDPLSRLTDRQREVLQLIGEGYGTRAIAERMFVSVKTVETHRAALLQRLGVRDVIGLVKTAIRLGLVRV